MSWPRDQFPRSHCGGASVLLWGSFSAQNNSSKASVAHKHFGWARQMKSGDDACPGKPWLPGRRLDFCHCLMKEKGCSMPSHPQGSRKWDTKSSLELLRGLLDWHISVAER